MIASKYVRSAALMLALGGLSASAISVSVAQDKAKKPADKEKMKVTGKIEIREGKDDKFRFIILGSDDKTIAQSTHAYESAAAAEKELDELKAVLASGIKPTIKKGEHEKEPSKEKSKEKAKP